MIGQECEEQKKGEQQNQRGRRISVNENSNHGRSSFTLVVDVVEKKRRITQRWVDYAKHIREQSREGGKLGKKEP